MDPTRLPHMYRYNAPVPQYTFNPMTTPNYGWPNTYPNYMSSYPMIPLYTYPNVPMYNQYETPLIVPTRFHQPNVIPQQRMQYSNPIYGIPQTQTTTHIIGTEPIQPPAEAVNVTKTKPFSRNSKLRWSINNKGHSKGKGKARASSYIPGNNATDQSEIMDSLRTSRKPDAKFYTAGKVATKYLKLRQKSSKRQRNTSHNTTGATTELSAIANDGNYKHLAVIVSDNGDPNDSEFETCDESEEEEEIYEESNWNVEDKESSQENSGQPPTKKSTSMDYTVIANDKSYSYVNYNPSVRATFKRKGRKQKRLGIKGLSRKLGDMLITKQSTPVETTSKAEDDKEKFTTDKIISRVLEASNNRMEKSRSPELWWDRSTDLGYDVMSKGKSPTPSLKDLSNKEESVANSEDISEVLTDCDENGNLTMAKSHDYEVVDFIDLTQKQTTKDQNDNESTLTQSKNGPAILNSQSQYLPASAINDTNYNVPNNTPANFDSVLGESHKINQTAPEVRSSYQQRKLLEVDWNAIQKILRNMTSQKSKPLGANSTTSVSKSVNPSISGQDSAILAYGKVSKVNSQNSKISDSERSQLFSKYRGKDSFNFPPTQFGSSDQNANEERAKPYTQNDSKVTTGQITATSSKAETSKTDITDVSKHKNKTYLVMHATLPSTPVKVKEAFASLRNKTFQSLPSPSVDVKTPKTIRGLSRRPSTCTKVKFANEDPNESLSRTISVPNLAGNQYVSMSSKDEKTNVKRKLDTTDVSKFQGKAIEHNKKDPNLATNVTPTNRTTSKKKFEMIRNLFNSAQSTSNDKVIKKTYNRRSLPSNLNRNTIASKVGSSFDDSSVSDNKSHGQTPLFKEGKSADESPQTIRRSASTNLLATPNKLVKLKPNLLTTTASMLNLTTPSRKNKLLYQKAKPPSTPFMISVKGIAHDKFSGSKSAPSTPSGILKNSKFHTFDIDIGEDSRKDIENYESAIAKHAEIVTIDDVAASFTGNEGDDEASSVSTKTSEHRFDTEVNDKSTLSNPKEYHNLPVSKECNVMKLITAKPFHSKKSFNNSDSNVKEEFSRSADNENDLNSDDSTIPTKLTSDILSKNPLPISNIPSNQKEATPKECVSSAEKSQMVVVPRKTTHNCPENLKQIKECKTVSEEVTTCKNPNFSAEKIQVLKDQTKQRDFQEVKFLPMYNSTKNFTFQEKDNSLSKNSTQSFSTSMNNQSKSFGDTSESCEDYYSLSIDGDSGFSLLNSEGSYSRIPNKQTMPINTPQTALFQAGLGRIRSPAMMQSSSMLLLGQVPYANTKQAKVKQLRSHFSQPTLAHPPTLVQPIAGAKPVIISNHDARTNINMNIVDNASAYQVYPCLAYKPVQNPRFKYGSVRKFKKTNRSFSTSRSYIDNKNSMKKRHFINIQKTTLNFSHPPLTVYNTSLEHPQVSALKSSNKHTKPQKPARKRLAAVCRLTKEDMQNIAKVTTPPKIATLKINLSDPDNGNQAHADNPNRTNIKSDVSQMSVANSSSIYTVKSTPDIKNVDYASTENDLAETVTLCDDATPTNLTKSKGKRWRRFFPRISNASSMSKLGGKHKTSGSIMKTRKLSKSITPKLKKPKDYCELNRALYKTSFLCIAPIESKATCVKTVKGVNMSKEDVFLPMEKTPNQPSSGNVGDYFGREFTSSTATIKKRSVRKSVGSTPGVRINSETGDFLDQTKGFGTFLCSTTIGDNIPEVDGDNRQNTGSFEGSSFRIHKKLFSQSDSPNSLKDCSTEIN